MEKKWTTKNGVEYTVSLTREKISKKELLEGLFGLVVISSIVWYFFFR